MGTSQLRRLRAPLVFIALSSVPVWVGGSVYGWRSVPDMIPVVIALAAALYIIGGTDTDAGAVVRRQADERQADQRLRVQALVGRALSVSVAVAYGIAVARGTALWPYAILLGILTVSFFGGWLYYGERGAQWAARPRSR